MPCINRTAETLIHFRRSELFYYFCIHPAFCRILLMPREPYILYLPIPGAFFALRESLFPWPDDVRCGNTRFWGGYRTIFLLVCFNHHIESHIYHFIDIQRVVYGNLPYFRILAAVNDKWCRHPILYGGLSAVAEVEAPPSGFRCRLRLGRPASSKQGIQACADVVFRLSHLE